MFVTTTLRLFHFISFMVVAAQRRPRPAALHLAGHALAAAVAGAVAARAGLGTSLAAAAAGCTTPPLPPALPALSLLEAAAAAALLLAWVPGAGTGHRAATLTLWSGTFAGGRALARLAVAAAVAAAARGERGNKAAAAAALLATLATLAASHPAPGMGACVGASPPGTGGPAPYAAALVWAPTLAWAGASAAAAAVAAACRACLLARAHPVAAAWAAPAVAHVLAPGGAGWAGALHLAALTPVVLASRPGRAAAPLPPPALAAAAGLAMTAAALLAAPGAGRPPPWDAAGENARWAVSLAGQVVQGLGVVAVLDGV